MKKISIKAGFILIAAILLPQIAGAQKYGAFDMETKIEFNNQYMWRGAYLMGAHIKPTITLGFNNFEVKTWGASDFTSSTSTVNIAASYYVKNFQFGLTDYWRNNSANTYDRAHRIEANAAYRFANVPLSLCWNTIISGDNNDSFSSYTEVSYAPQMNDWTFDLSVGVTPWENEMLGTEDLQITKMSASVSRKFDLGKGFSFGPSAGLVYNPFRDKMYLTCGVCLFFK